METKQKEDEMGDGTQATDLGCQNNMSAEKRHRNIELEIELDPRAYKECACQKFAKCSAMPSEIERGQTEDDQCNENCGDHAAIEWPNETPDQRPRARCNISRSQRIDGKHAESGTQRGFKEDRRFIGWLGTLCFTNSSQH